MIVFFIKAQLLVACIILAMASAIQCTSKCDTSSSACGHRHHSRHVGVSHGIPNTSFQLVGEDASASWVSLATDLTNLEYVLNLPLTAYIWTHFLHIRPLVFIVPRSAFLSVRERFIIEWARKAGARIEIVLPRTDDMVSTVAQNVRLAAWALPYVQPNDYIVSADVDIWPISHEYWSDALANRSGVTIVNGEFFTQNAHGDDRVAISYVGMRAGLWGGVVGTALGIPIGLEAESMHAQNSSGMLASQAYTIRRQPAADEVVAAILDLGRKCVGKHAWDAPLAGQALKTHAQWSWDQRFMTKAILGAENTSHTHYKLGKDLMSRRLDRIRWNFNGNAESYSDAHLLSPLTDEAVWERLRAVWISMFGDATWADEYIDGARDMFLVNNTRA